MTNAAMWALVVGFFLPPVVSVVKQSKWTSKGQSVLLFVISVPVSVGTVYFTEDDWDWRNFIGTALFVLVTAIATYHGLWKPSGADEKIAKATDVTPSGP